MIGGFVKYGLCDDCLHRREIRSDRGSVFTMCTRGLLDPAYPKYPHVPVIRCRGFEDCKVESSFGVNGR